VRPLLSRGVQVTERRQYFDRCVVGGAVTTGAVVGGGTASVVVALVVVEADVLDEGAAFVAVCFAELPHPLMRSAAATHIAPERTSAYCPITRSRANAERQICVASDGHPV
jgi:hypothetical protein